MRAILRTRYGSPDVLTLGHVDVPVVRDDEVLIRIHGASINQGDYFVLTGRPFVTRLMFGLLKPRSRLLGMDAAGVVHAVGKDVTRFRPGDEVYGELAGAYAEYACAREDRIAHKPKRVGFAEAAALPVAGVTALQGMRDVANVKPGQHVLVNGASGGVGTFAVQVAKAFGAEVTAVVSTRNADLARSIGADHVVDYTRQDFTATGARYDVVFDLVGSARIPDCLRILHTKGVYVASVGHLGFLLEAFARSLFTRRVAVLAAQPNAADLTALAQLVDEGRVTPVIDRRYTLADVPEALRYQGRGRTQGKSVITV